jgi:hypothetical protein
MRPIDFATGGQHWNMGEANGASAGYQAQDVTEPHARSRRRTLKINQWPECLSGCGKLHGNPRFKAICQFLHVHSFSTKGRSARWAAVISGRYRIAGNCVLILRHL